MMDQEEQDMIVIDGSQGEGGGQVLRISTALSVLLSIPIRVINIRAGRKKPGLAAQHLKGLELARDLCHGTLTGGFIGSTEITLNPGKIVSDASIKVDVGTAGSVVLLLQTALPIMLFSSGSLSLELIGGTNADMAPPIDYFIEVFTVFVKKHFNIDFEVELVRRGFYPKGQGCVRVKTSPFNGTLPSVDLTDPGTHYVSVTGTSFVAGVLPIKAAHEAADAAEALIRKSLKTIESKEDKGKSTGNKTRIKVTRVKDPTDKAVGTGSGIILIAESDTGCILASSSLGQRGKSSVEVGREAAEGLLEQIKTVNQCVDQHMQDQILIFLALSEGTSRVKTGNLTLHSQTAIQVIEIITKRKIFTVESSDDSSVIISCNGIAFKTIK